MSNIVKVTQILPDNSTVEWVNIYDDEGGISVMTKAFYDAQQEAIANFTLPTGGND